MIDKTEWVMVPREWTPDMWSSFLAKPNYPEGLRAALAAAPTPPAQDPREAALDAMAENARELGLDYTAPAQETQPPCAGMNCGSTDGKTHSAECYAEHAATIDGGRFAKGDAPPAASPTCGMNIAQRILHVGGRNNEAGYVEFGSLQAVEALVNQVLRDVMPDAARRIAELEVELAEARKIIEECRDALAEELAAWDIDPPIHHVQQAHAHCVEWLAAIAKEKS